MIPPDKTLVVTGEPRSRTSLMMGMLGILGVPRAGNMFPHRLQQADASPAEITDARRRAKRIETLNPHGFWELSGVVGRGIVTAGEKQQCLGQAVKIVSNGAWPNVTGDGRPIGTDPALVDRYIVCLRDPRAVAASQTHLMGDVEVADTGTDQGWANEPRPMDPLRYLAGMGRFALWAANQPAVQLRMLMVDHGEWDADVEATLTRVGAFLGVTVGNDEISKAQALFDPTLTRVDRQVAWPAGQAAAGALATELYEGLLAEDWAAIGALKSSVEQELAEAAKARHLWLDIDPLPGQEDMFFGTWTPTNAGHYKLLAANTNGCRETLRVSLIRKRAERPSLCPKDCPFYTRSRQQQAVEMPVELNVFPMTAAGRVAQVPLVDCGRDGDTKTHLECMACWQRGSVRGGRVISPERLAGSEK